MSCFFSRLKSSPINTIADWQDSRAPWLILTIAMAGLVILAHSFFQNYIYMLPCEQCVYIRFSMLVMALGGLVALINPKNLILKLVAYVLAFYGGIIGVMYSVKLDNIHKAVHGDDPFGVQGCSTDPTFPFNLPLHKWAPDWFQPTGDCGYDNPIVPMDATLSGIQKFFIDFYSDGWYLWPASHFGNMAQCTLLAYVVALAILVAMLVCFVIKKVKKAN
ncbi:protein-disulfide oxidoreductase DsbI [uncultured Campylobacter sp.]|uniref:protein-disulfide oxidoreductase DsbI n=1 Tax=uncultured Campylobacter sp. TaxID=218934 RepID=UPI00263A161A|nr:protein-disulfide oxidoreductase DsbI [uncultured Campylobacter sp.]